MTGDCHPNELHDCQSEVYSEGSIRIFQSEQNKLWCRKKTLCLIWRMGFARITRYSEFLPDKFYMNLFIRQEDRRKTNK